LPRTLGDFGLTEAAEISQLERLPLFLWQLVQRGDHEAASLRVFGVGGRVARRPR